MFSWRLRVLFFLIFFFVFDDINGVEGFHKVYRGFQSLSPGNVSQVQRTGYHFQPKKNWINDPNGPMYFKGLYHFFYQYNPKGVVWGNIVWAHSVSRDLINWQKLEYALYPSKPFDKYGCWSGSTTILPGDKPIILYTGIVNLSPHPGSAVQNYAIPANSSDPYLRKWIKPDNNPLIAPTKSENINISSFRDPTTAWFGDGHWKILVGSLRKHRGLVYLYRSRDFVKWVRAKHPMHSKAGTHMWECPDFYPVRVKGRKGLDNSALGENVKHVLKVSLDQTKFDYYTVGRYDPKMERYYPDNTSVDGLKGLRYDYGKFYGSKSFFDPSKDRRVLWGWANESDSVEDDVLKGWAGIQLIPRTIWLDPSGKQLLLWPVEEIETLRCHKVEMSNVNLKKGDNVEVKGITAAQADVDVSFSFSNLDKAEPFDPSWAELYALDVCAIRGSTVNGGLGPFGLLTLASKNLEEYTAVFFRVFKFEGKYKVLMCSDPRRSSLGKGMWTPTFAGYVDVDLANKKLSLRSLIDHSVVESFAEGGKTCITTRVYPTLAVFENAHLHVYNNGTEIITVERLDAWSMKKPDQMN